MNEEERIVAAVSPWDHLANLVKKEFRVQSLPREKKVLVWREDLTNEEELVAAVKEAGIESIEVRSRKAMDGWEA